MPNPTPTTSPTNLDTCAHAVIDAAIEVHRHLGPGFPDPVYAEALVFELEARGLAVQRHVPIPVRYKGVEVSEVCLDLVVDDRIVIELKSTDHLAGAQVAQLGSYLRATGYALGLLVTFNVPVMREGIRRVPPAQT